MAATLLVARLSIQSSYAENAEYEAEGNDFDTIQWWLGEDESWRIKTYAVDSDIHTHLIAGPVAVSVATENTRKHYGDVIAEEYVVEFANHLDQTEVQEKMAKLGGKAALEISPDKRFAFWNVDGRRYSTKTTPQG